ncbi:ATP-dependent DNA ligase [Streptomyces sp. NPDC020667]|uniref:ATP-dependent DNA ligase n=1 Tax=Streptomyces sp. NPDC020667 TaxID=3154895 RepID=UPI0033E8B5D4
MLTPPIEPILAQARDTLPRPGEVADPIWQQKADGYRCLAFIRSGTVLLQSRRGADLTAAFPEFVEAAADIDEDLVVDGELVVFHGGRLDFAALQQRARRRGRGAVAAARTVPALLVLFDLLEAPGGEVLFSRPYRERWARLEALFSSGVLRSPWTLTASTDDRATAQEWLDPAWGRVGIEGVVVKAGTGTYRPGQRGSWWKVRTFESHEGIIAGVTGPVRSPHSLLLARYDMAGRLRFIGRTTPLSAAARRELGTVLVPGGPEHPWTGIRISAGWSSTEHLRYDTVQPDTVAEYRADTAAERGRHRHPVRYLRTRSDLTPADIEPLSAD